jgi:ATP-dependent Clp protease adapter protein ClpS
MKEWEQTSIYDGVEGPYVVIVYNDDWHTFEQVIKQLCKATACSPEKAWEIANEIHTTGRAIAYAGSQEECERVAGILREIRLQVETDKSV